MFEIKPYIKLKIRCYLIVVHYLCIVVPTIPNCEEEATFLFVIAEETDEV